MKRCVKALQLTSKSPPKGTKAAMVPETGADEPGSLFICRRGHGQLWGEECLPRPSNCLRMAAPIVAAKPRGGNKLTLASQISLATPFEKAKVPERKSWLGKPMTDRKPFAESQR